MSRSLPQIARVAEEVLGNRLGAGVYRRWVRGLGLRGDERVLEVGTGAGACARHLLDSLPTGRLTCVDCDSRWLDIARRRLAGFGDRAEFLASDVCDLAVTGFDAAIVHFVLHDIPPVDRMTAMAATARTLRPGGRLYIREPLDHGMSAAEMHECCAAAGLTPEREAVQERLPLMGPATSEVWLNAVNDRGGVARPARTASATPR